MEIAIIRRDAGACIRAKTHPLHVDLRLAQHRIQEKANDAVVVKSVENGTFVWYVWLWLEVPRLRGNSVLPGIQAIQVLLNHGIGNVSGSVYSVNLVLDIRLDLFQTNAVYERGHSCRRVARIIADVK